MHETKPISTVEMVEITSLLRFSRFKANEGDHKNTSKITSLLVMKYIYIFIKLNKERMRERTMCFLM